MGKKRKTGGGRADNLGKKGGGKATTYNKEDSLLNPSSRGFVYDEVDDFEDERDRLSLSRAQALMGRPRADREQVLAIDGSSSEDDDENEDEESDEDAMYMEDDIVEEEEDQGPDDRAWGSQKWRYIGTDTTDERISKVAKGQEEEEFAQLEEEAARKLQERMAAELQDLVVDDFLPQNTKKEKKPSTADASVTLDLTKLSRTKKLQLLKSESPEFMPLLEDFKDKLQELRTFLAPLMEGVKGGLITSPALCHYLSTKYRLLLNYVCVLSVYMLTKSSLGVVGQHPVVGRLAQYRQLLQELSPCDEKLRPQLEDLLPKIKAAKTVTSGAGKSSKKPRQLQLLIGRKGRTQITSNNKKEFEKRKLSDVLGEEEEEEEQGSKQKQRIKKQEPQKHLNAAEASSDEEEQKQAMRGEEREGEEGEDALDPEGKRAITYQIAKNKGLTPSRKKEQRNPRVKYRRKYQTKLKRRKGQVRLVRKETKRYEGEVSGIKSHTIKSIKIG